MRVPAFVAILLALSAGAESVAAAAPTGGEGIAAARLNLEAGAALFSWREYDGAGQRLLAERGPRYRLGAGYGNFTTASTGLLFDATAIGYVGDVDYDGQDNGGRFVATETRYRGYAAAARFGYRHPLPRAALAVDVFGGLDLAHWRRDIRSGVNAVGLPVAGFSEDYTVISGRLGLGLMHAAGRTPARLAAGVRLPFDVDEDVAIGGQRVALEPGRRPSAFLSWHLSLAPGSDGAPFGTYLHLSWETYRFDRSPARAIGSLSVWQPESRMDEIALTLGMRY